jgi:hypothetical protein
MYLSKTGCKTVNLIEKADDRICWQGLFMNSAEYVPRITGVFGFKLRSLGTLEKTVFISTDT